MGWRQACFFLRPRGGGRKRAGEEGRRAAKGKKMTPVKNSGLPFSPVHYGFRMNSVKPSHTVLWSFAENSKKSKMDLSPKVTPQVQLRASGSGYNPPTNLRGGDSWTCCSLCGQAVNKKNDETPRHFSNAIFVEGFIYIFRQFGVA